MEKKRKKKTQNWKLCGCVGVTSAPLFFLFPQCHVPNKNSVFIPCKSAKNAASQMDVCLTRDDSPFHLSLPPPDTPPDTFLSGWFKSLGLYVIIKREKVFVCVYFSYHISRAQHIYISPCSSVSALWMDWCLKLQNLTAFSDSFLRCDRKLQVRKRNASTTPTQKKKKKKKRCRILTTNYIGSVKILLIWKY